MHIRIDYRNGGERLSQKCGERQDHHPDKSMESRVCQTDRRKANTQSAVSCIERGSERNRENQQEYLQYLAARTATPQSEVTDKVAE